MTFLKLDLAFIEKIFVQIKENKVVACKRKCYIAHVIQVIKPPTSTIDGVKRVDCTDMKPFHHIFLEAAIQSIGRGRQLIFAVFSSKNETFSKWKSAIITPIIKHSSR